MSLLIMFYTLAKIAIITFLAFVVGDYYRGKAKLNMFRGVVIFLVYILALITFI